MKYNPFYGFNNQTIKYFDEDPYTNKQVKVTITETEIDKDGTRLVIKDNALLEENDLRYLIDDFQIKQGHVKFRKDYIKFIRDSNVLFKLLHLSINHYIMYYQSNK